MSPLPLEELLDVSTLDNNDQISQRFLEIAKAILFSYFLCVEYEGKSTDFQILEIEFYLRKDGVHEDPFCHAHDDQRGSAKWYFHRTSAGSCSTLTDAGGYRGGTRKGLDITFGTPVASPFFPVPQDTSLQPRGGILLRSMRSMDGNGVVTSGPSLLVDKILSITKSRNISGLVNTKLGGFTSALPPMKGETALGTHPAKVYLAPCSRTADAQLPIHRSPRVGLDLAHPSVVPQRNDLRVQYISKLYRYFVHPELLKANGRCHTFIGILLEQYPTEPTTSESFDCPILMARLRKMTTLKHATLQKYIEDYTQGLMKRSLKEYVGSAGKGASSNPQIFMRMMGVLRRMGMLTTSDAAWITGT